MKSEPAEVGALVVDSLPFSQGGTAAQALALKAAGVRCLVGYLGAISADRLGLPHGGGPCLHARHLRHGPEVTTADRRRRTTARRWGSPRGARSGSISRGFPPSVKIRRSSSPTPTPGRWTLRRRATCRASMSASLNPSRAPSSGRFGMSVTGMGKETSGIATTRRRRRSAASA